MDENNADYILGLQYEISERDKSIAELVNLLEQNINCIENVLAGYCDEAFEDYGSVSKLQSDNRELINKYKK